MYQKGALGAIGRPGLETGQAKAETRNRDPKPENASMDRRPKRELTEIALRAAGGGLLAAVVLIFTLAAVQGVVDHRYASPRATLRTYEAAVLVVDEEAEILCASSRLRAEIERTRGPDKARRRTMLAGKAAFFRTNPIVFVKEKVWGDRAKVLVTQGGPPDRPVTWIYSFVREADLWKVDLIERSQDLGW